MKTITCPVNFTFDGTLDGLGILGQNGFFEQFIVEFDRKNTLLRLID
jgi:hypothetical protein